LRKESSRLVEFYDKLSGNYDELYGGEQLAKHQKVLELLEGKDFGIGVDVACGTGALLQRLRGKCDYLLGVDLSRKMLLVAKGKAGFGDIGLIRADCQALPLVESVADLLLAISLVDAGPPARKQVSQLARVAKPDGVLVISMFHPEGKRINLQEIGMGKVDVQLELSARETLFRLGHRE
jgi:ubiquinone/menaquinone biosynthesis C-methylase UbiE